MLPTLLNIYLGFDIGFSLALIFEELLLLKVTYYASYKRELRKINVTKFNFKHQLLLLNFASNLGSDKDILLRK